MTSSTTPAQIEAALCRAAALALLGDRVSLSDRRQAEQTLALLELIPNPLHRRATAMRCIPARSTGKLHRWSEIARALKVTPMTLRKWHAANMAQLAGALNAEKAS